MKKKLSKILSMMLILVMTMCLVTPVSVEAKSTEPYFPGDIDFLYYAKDKPLNTEQWILGEKGTNYKVSSLKSSNKKIVTVSKIYDQEYTCIKFKVKKAGTATISFKVKTGSKTYNYKCPVKVTKYANPVKTLEIGSNNYASKFKKNNYYDLGGEKTHKGNLAIKTNKNWEIEDIYIYDINTHKEKKSKNNNKVTIKCNQNLWVICKNKKTGALISVGITNYKQ